MWDSIRDLDRLNEMVNHPVHNFACRALDNEFGAAFSVLQRKRLLGSLDFAENWDSANPTTHGILPLRHSSTGALALVFQLLRMQRVHGPAFSARVL